jgi:hypothetical protein
MPCESHARLSVIALMIALPSVAFADRIDLGDDRWINVGALIQPQFVLAQRGAPDGGVSSDMFLRRGRILLAGQFDSAISFVFDTDEPNWGKGGDYSSTFLIQDALASYTVAPGLTISAGFMLVPFLRNNIESANALNTVDFRTAVIRFPTAHAFRDAGAELRGLLVGDRIYYRVGVFNGIAGRAATMTTEAVNATDAPRLTGMIRYNIKGKDDAYALPGIYFGTEPVISVGVGADLQNNAIGTVSTPSPRYLAYAADAFVDIPFDANNELVAEGAAIRYDHYPAGMVPDTAFAFYAQAGYRIFAIEPVASVEYFNGRLPGSKITNYRFGIDYWVRKHTYNVKAELTIPRQEQVAGAAIVENNLTGILQAQLAF